VGSAQAGPLVGRDVADQEHGWDEGNVRAVVHRLFESEQIHAVGEVAPVTVGTRAVLELVLADLRLVLGRRLVVPAMGDLPRSRREPDGRTRSRGGRVILPIGQKGGDGRAGGSTTTRRHGSAHTIWAFSTWVA